MHSKGETLGDRMKSAFKLLKINRQLTDCWPLVRALHPGIWYFFKAKRFVMFKQTNVRKIITADEEQTCLGIVLIRLEKILQLFL